MEQLKSRAMQGEMVNINKVPTTHRTIQRCSQGLLLKESLKKTQVFLTERKPTENLCFETASVSLFLGTHKAKCCLGQTESGMVLDGWVRLQPE